MITLQYVKKEDAEHFINLRYKSLGIMYISFALVFSYMAYSVVPKISETFYTAGKDLPLSYVFSPFISVIVVVASLVLSIVYLTRRVDKKLLQQKLKSYKSSEMIRSNKVLDMRDTYLALSYFAIVLTIFILGMIMPIYSLTSN